MTVKKCLQTCTVLRHTETWGRKKNVCPIYIYQNVLSYFEPSVKVNESYTATTTKNKFIHADIKLEGGKRKTMIGHTRETLQSLVQNENTGSVLQNYKEFQNRRVLNQVWCPSKHEVLLNGDPVWLHESHTHEASPEPHLHSLPDGKCDSCVGLGNLKLIGNNCFRYEITES